MTPVNEYEMDPRTKEALHKIRNYMREPDRILAQKLIKESLLELSAHVGPKKLRSFIILLMKLKVYEHAGLKKLP